MHRGASAYDAASAVVGPPTVSEICNPTRVRKQLIEITFKRVRAAFAFSPSLLLVDEGEIKFHGKVERRQGSLRK